MRLNKAIQLFLLLATILASLHPSQAQDRRFKGGLIIGMNASQLDGDLTAGYDRFGLQAGVRGVIVLTQKKEISIELLYSQRGSHSKAGDPIPISIGLNYAEVPVFFNFLDWAAEGGKNDEEFYRVHAYAGVSVARLLGSNVNIEAPHYQVQDRFTKTDLSLSAGATFYVTPGWGLSARYTRSITPVYNTRKYNNVPNLYSLLGYMFNFQSVFMF